MCKPSNIIVHCSNRPFKNCEVTSKSNDVIFIPATRLHIFLLDIFDFIGEGINLVRQFLQPIIWDGFLWSRANPKTIYFGN